MNRHKSTTENRLILGGFAILLFVGGGLTAIVLGVNIAAMAISVVLLALGLLLMICMGLSSLERWLKRGE